MKILHLYLFYPSTVLHTQWLTTVIMISFFLLLHKPPCGGRKETLHIYTVDSRYNDSEHLLRYHCYTQYIVVYDFRYIKWYLQIFFLKFGRWPICEVSHVLHSGDQRFGRRINNAVLTEIFWRFSCIDNYLLQWYYIDIWCILHLKFNILVIFTKSSIRPRANVYV